MKLHDMRSMYFRILPEAERIMERDSFMSAS
jgi:hypothetical protein